ncbi:YceD family protein [Pseudoprimorskyibacter insulae]|uniref:Large ribosomal RNA subunit accumulation protein YceD n=1 Tax=Pseudoprimorskyibacter insulae TaxID=1695997 RepID=A0A2R8AWA6_9RHOB|nr:DUF177 domain-containing protein [Pseudoprimorskyibacter insulae]SPF80332.1 hypothetical protein PRI8871_02136 [Pseudoprimorskyibacter insulae]
MSRIQVKEITTIMPPNDEIEGQYRVAALSTRHPTRFEITPNDAGRKEIARELGLLGLRKLRFKGQIAPKGKRGWILTGDLGATVVQACVVTTDPVSTRIETEVLRRYEPEDLVFQAQEAGSESEMPEDDSLEPLGEVISVNDVLREALSLALPTYPRSDTAEMGEAVFADEGIAPMTDDDAKPFAGLKSLRDALENPDKS